MNKSFQYRHGDVLLERVNSIPATTVPEDGRILAHGEVTGHAHRIDQGQLRRDLDGQLWVSSSKKMTLTHEEHGRIDLPRGNYRVTIQREYVPGELPRQVVD